MSKYVTNFTGLVALNEGLSEKCREIYTDLVDPSCGYELSDRGVFKILEDGKITVDKLLDICDVELDWYIPSDFAIEFILFIRLALGEEPENSNPKSHYFFADCIFQQPNVEPYFAIRGYDYYELNNRIATLCTREFSKSTLMAYMFLYIAYHGKIPGFGKIYYMIYCGDSMDNNVKTTMKTIKKVFLESPYLKSKFEDWVLNTDSVEFVRKPQTRKEIENYTRHMDSGGKATEVPGRMKRTFTLKGVGAATGARGSRDALARPDGVVFDDLVPSESAAASEPVLKSIESTIKSDLLPGLNNNKNFAILIGTPYSKKDPVYSRIERKSWLPIMFPRGIVVKDRKAGPISEDANSSNFKSVWEDRHGFKNCMKDFKSALLDKEGGDASAVRSILQEHYLRITSNEDRMIGEQLIQWYSRTAIERKLSSYNVYATTDFTTSGSAGADMSGIAFWALGPNGDIYMLDLCLRRQELEDQYSELFRMNNYWRRRTRRAIEVGIEVDGQQRAHISAIKSKMILNNEWFTIGRQRGSKPGSEGILSRLESGNKHWRFRMMLPLFQNRKIHFPEELRDTPDMRELMEQIKYATYTGFGCLSGDTMIDTPFGQSKIMNVQNNDSVVVHTGDTSALSKVKNHIITGVKQTYTVATDSGEMHLTACHKVLTMRGYVEVKDLLNTDLIIRSSFWNKLNNTDTNGQTEAEDTINPLQKLMAKEDGCTELSMKEKLDLFLVDMRSIISMKINQITHYITLKCYRLETTSLSMLEKKSTGTTESAGPNYVQLQDSKKELQMQNLNTRRVRFVEHISSSKNEIDMTQNTAVLDAGFKLQNLRIIRAIHLFLMCSALYVIHGLTKGQQIISAVQMSATESMKNKSEKQELRFVNAVNAEQNLQTLKAVKESTVALNVQILQETNLMSNARAETVEKRLWQNLLKLNTAQIAANVSSIVTINARKIEPVYDFEIRSTHNYVANGMVVHNSKCDDGADLISQLGMMETIAPLPDMYSDDDIEDEQDDFIEDEYGQRRSPKRFSDGVYKVKRKKDTSGNMYDLYS